jgi:ferric-dicitrate binding protein FerR (iron transport regulator)
MESIDSRKALKKVKGRIRNQLKPARRFLFYWQKIAAVLILPLLVYIFLQMAGANLFSSAKELTWYTITTPVGLRGLFELPDGTQVYLNSNTFLRYPSEFKGNERLVQLEGEAFFEVESDKKHPFIVDAGDMQVQAVGTAFNVLAYPGDSVIETALIEGRVDLLKVKDSKRILMSRLTAGQMAVYKPRKDYLQRYAGDLSKFVAWKDGKILFDNDPLNEVVRRLEHWYNVDFCFSENVPQDYAYTGAFKGESLDQILEYIELTTPVEFTISSPKQEDDTTYVKRKIVVSMKKN